MVRTPLYKEVKGKIVQSLIDSEWRPGELIPNEKQLAQRFGVAISTIRAAIGELVAAGVLVRIQGKGTLVTHHDEIRNAYRFFNLYQHNGTKATFYRDLLRISRESPTPEIAARLKLTDPDAQIYRLRVRISAQGGPIAMADLSVPEEVFPDLEHKIDVDGNTSLYALFQTAYNVNVIHVVEGLTAAKANALLAKTIGVKAGEPLLRVDRTAFTFNQRPVETRTTWIHTKHHRYLVDRGDERH